MQAATTHYIPHHTSGCTLGHTSNQHTNPHIQAHHSANIHHNPGTHHPDAERQSEHREAPGPEKRPAGHALAVVDNDES